MKDNVKRYLKDNYQVSEEEIDAALATEDAARILENCERMGSYPYFAGDEIANTFDWEGIEEPAEDAYDGTPDDEKADTVPIQEG
jgi:hypothetical protein